MSAQRVTARTLLSGTLILLYILTFGYAALRLTFPSDGARLVFQAHTDYPNTISVSPFRDGEMPVQRGDYILRVDGQTIPVASLQIFSPASLSPQWHAGQTVNYTVIREGAMLELTVPLGLFPLSAVLRENIAVILFLIFLQVEAAWIWSIRRDERASQVLLLAVSSFCLFSVCWYLGTDVPMLVNAPWMILCYRALTFTLLMVMCSAILHFSLILPRRKDQPALPTYLIPVIYLTPFLLFPLVMVLLYDPNLGEWLRRWEISMISLIFVAFILALLAFFYGYRQARHRVPRLHVRIIAITFAIAAALAVLYGIPIILTGQSTLGWNVLPLLSLPIALGLGIAVVFYRLFDIRVVIQRTLVWGALTVLIISTYVLVVGGLSILFQQGDPIFSLIATGMVAVMFHGVRTRLQTWVSSRLYGEVNKPDKVLKRITQQIETAAPDETFSEFVYTVGTALKLPYCAIELEAGGKYQLAAAWGTPSAERIEYPLTFHSEQVGRFIVCPRAAGETLTTDDQDLLRGLVDQAEVLIEMARLNSALQASRENLVIAREEERRRLRRDLHDGLGPALASLALQLDAARNVLTRDPEQTQVILTDLKDQVKSAVVDVRRLVYELRPPALDELGLIGAIREKARQFELDGTLSITVEAPPTLPPLPAALEVAAYRIVTEAMTNVVRHAGATTCAVRLTVNGAVVISIQDNGKGLPEKLRTGVGIRSMAERAAELGGTCTLDASPQGGTLVCARLPYTTKETTP
jgi:signal transduction histidine kinase